MKKRGFTLIELLAVITILAIILLITIPIILNVIEDSKKETSRESIELYGRAIEQAVNNYFMKYPGEEYVTFEKLEKENMIQYKGSKIECDTIYIIDGEVFLNECKIAGKKIDKSYGNKIKNMMARGGEYIETDDETLYYFLNTNIESRKISKFTIHTSETTFLDEYESKDCSYNQDGSVMCYWKEDSENTGYYDMHIAAVGEIYTPFNSSYLFADLKYYKLQELNLTGLNTKYTINMRGMFEQTGYSKMTSLNLGDKFDTSNVTDMTAMFEQTGYSKMTSLNLGDKFDTSNVTNMWNMFASTGYKSMTSLNLGNNFDTSNVINMSGMFHSTGRQSLTSLNLGKKFDTSKVKLMLSMFYALGEDSMATLNLGKKFVINEDVDISSMFGFCGKNSEDMRVIVGSQELKNKIKNMNDNDLKSREFWKTNDNVIVVQ